MTEDIEKYEARHPDTKEVAVSPGPNAANSPAAVMIMALNKGVDIERLEKLLQIQQAWETNEARKAYYEAVAAFKENPPEILKDKENFQFSKGDKKAMYASLGSLVKAVNPALGKYGLSASWNIEQAEKLVKVSCKLSHRLGHSESVTMEAPPDISGGAAKNPIQQIKSTITYLRSLTFEAVTGLAATDEANLDDDGNSASGVEYINEKQLSSIVDMINSKNIDETPFLKYMKVESAEQIQAKDFEKAMAALKKAKGREKSPEREPGSDDK
uniref:Putative Erf family protein n=1 Tax=viral metagenome TaxID=1070528 RepID=A0A6M3JH77_9ZZZZ